MKSLPQYDGAVIGTHVALTPSDLIAIQHALNMAIANAFNWDHRSQRQFLAAAHAISREIETLDKEEGPCYYTMV